MIKHSCYFRLSGLAYLYRLVIRAVYDVYIIREKRLAVMRRAYDRAEGGFSVFIFHFFIRCIKREGERFISRRGEYERSRLLVPPIPRVSVCAVCVFESPRDPRVPLFEAYWLRFRLRVSFLLAHVRPIFCVVI